MSVGRRNKVAGSNFEREMAQKMREIGFTDVITTRQGSRELDALKIDLMNGSISKEGRLPYSIQCKNVKGHLPYAKVISELPREEGYTNVIFHKMTVKKNNRFVEQDRFAILYLEDFFKLIKKIREYEHRDN